MTRKTNLLPILFVIFIALATVVSCGRSDNRSHLGKEELIKAVTDYWKAKSLLTAENPVYEELRKSLQTYLYQGPANYWGGVGENADPRTHVFVLEGTFSVESIRPIHTMIAMDKNYKQIFADFYTVTVSDPQIGELINKEFVRNQFDSRFPIDIINTAAGPKILSDISLDHNLWVLQTDVPLLIRNWKPLPTIQYCAPFCK